MKNLKKARKAKHLTQLAVRMKTGIDQSLLSKYENDERQPTVENLILLADLYGTNMDYLMDRTDEKEPLPPKVP